MSKYCEIPYKCFSKTKSNRCEHKGFSRCLLHNKEITEDVDGYVECCKECKTPHFIPRNRKGKVK